MSYQQHLANDWLFVYKVLELERLDLPFELFRDRPWSILHGLDRLDALKTIEAGERPNPVEPATPAWWDAIYHLCPFAEAGITREAFRACPWPLLLRYRLESVPRRLRGGPDGPGGSGDGQSGSDPGSGGGAQPVRSSSTRSGAAGASSPGQRGLLSRAMDGLAAMVDSYYPMRRSCDGRLRLDRARIAAGGDRYSVRLITLSLIGATALGLMSGNGASLREMLPMMGLWLVPLGALLPVMLAESRTKG